MNAKKREWVRLKCSTNECETLFGREAVAEQIPRVLLTSLRKRYSLTDLAG